MGKLVLVLAIFALTTAFNNAASIKKAIKSEDANQPLYKLAAVLPELEEHGAAKDTRPRDRNLLRTMLIDEYPDFELGEYGDEALQKFASALEKMNRVKRTHFHSELKDLLDAGKRWRGDEASLKDANGDFPRAGSTNWRGDQAAMKDTAGKGNWRGDQKLKLETSLKDANGDRPDSSRHWRGDQATMKDSAEKGNSRGDQAFLKDAAGKPRSSTLVWRGDQASLKDAAGKGIEENVWSGDVPSNSRRWRGDQASMSSLSDQALTKDAMGKPRHRSTYRVIRDDEKNAPFPGTLAWMRGDHSPPLLHRGDQKENPNRSLRNWRGDEKTRKLNALFENLLEVYKRDMSNRKQAIPQWRGDENTEH